jgi:hypothetical protein
MSVVATRDGVSPNGYLVVNASTNSVTSNNQSSSTRDIRLNSDLSALSIRATEYLQRWKEVVQFSSKDYSDQMAAQFGIKAPEYMGNHAHYIGGWSNVININEVVNTNLDTDSSQASIAGKGVSSQSGHTITYDCGAEHQIIMCVYHAVPMLDWNLTGQAPQLTVTAISDFPNLHLISLVCRLYLLLISKIIPDVTFPVLLVTIFATGSGNLILIPFTLDFVLVLLISLGLLLLMAGKC